MTPPTPTPTPTPPPTPTPTQPAGPPQPLAVVTSLKVKLGLLVAISAAVAAGIASLGSSAGVAAWLSIPVTIALALGVTQLLAVGMTSPLRQMTAAARRMATGDYGVRVDETSRDEVGDLARAFNTMARDLADVDRQRRELVANVSHELRTPLAGLIAVLDNLVDGVAPSDPDALATVLRQAERMSALVEDLLDLARVDAGKAPLRAEPVALAGLVAEAVAEVATLGRAVEYDVAVPSDLTLSADPGRLGQLVANLLDNASRHSPAGGVVRVVAERVGDGVRLEVSDQGPGVSPVDRERVFEAFGTLQATEGGGGTGLGLAIARWVTDLHGGRISFVDPAPAPGPDPGPGARVRVELPLASPRPSMPRPSTLPSEEPVPPPPPPPTSPVSPVSPAPAESRPVTTPSTPSLLDDVFDALWAGRDVPARIGLLAGALAVGLLAAIVIPDRDFGLGTSLVLLAGGAVVLTASPQRRDPFTLACAALCAALAVVPTVRDAEWIAVLSVLAGGLVCVVGVTRGRTLPGFVLSALAWPLAGLRGLPWLGRTLSGLVGLGHGAALLRTVVWSVLGLVVFGLLFASADALLAEWVDAVVPDLTADLFVARIFVTVFVAGAVLAAAYVALNPPTVDRVGERRAVTRRYEWLAPVGVVIAVFAAFLTAQATVVFGGHDYLRRTTGLTYADYVHQGFGQLTVATALTLVVIWAAARKAPRETAADRAWLRGSLGLLCVLTLVVVASALHRMALYQEAYGFTRLRLLVDVFEGWLGLLVLAVLVSGIALNGRWLARFALLTGVAAVLGIAAINPDAWIARHNLDRYESDGKVDWTYLQGLSEDAVPEYDDLPAIERACALFGRHLSDDDWLEWNLGRARADLSASDIPASDDVVCPDPREEAIR
ncbi:DUF4173 domain-containing protein [Nocardioides caeni]|uniref:Signal transduction histidine-protein kinase/phosphatase MprB n=1 Tax=Nocardioides caeni TaxID=574700 RepID=A0A4S8N590_9ACTN|nr:DUF4153 domain-containing protein [Nocardioides caeni]THV10069.1 DUF4173 domain-containing protein [Nocardioides caeni]